MNPPPENEPPKKAGRKWSLEALARCLQSGSIGGLLAIPFLVELTQYRDNPPLDVAAIVLLVVALLASLMLGRLSSPERGLWGAVLAVVLFVLTLSQPVIL